MRKLTLFGGPAVVALLIAGSAAADGGRADWWPPESAPLVGTWQVEVTVRFHAPDCASSPPVPFGPNPFPSLNTFHAGGTMSETGSRSPPSMRSPGHGIWERTGRRSYEARFTFQGFEASGSLAANMDIRSHIALSADGQSFEGTSRLQLTDISGNVMPFCATLSGIRFSL